MVTALVLWARGITKSFGDIVALDCIDVDVTQGQIHGLVGRNGAGKTTFSGLLPGLAVADRGTLEVLGTSVRPALAAPDGATGFVDGPGRHPSLTAPGSLAAPAGLHRSRRADGRDRRPPRAGLPISP